jgi:hypothetical protein
MESRGGGMWGRVALRPEKNKNKKREGKKGDVLWAFTWEREGAGAHGVRWPEGGVGGARKNWWH